MSKFLAAKKPLAKAVGKATDAIANLRSMALPEDEASATAELVLRGYPESTARKIVSGELPMDEASRMQRAYDQGFGVKDAWYHGTAGDFDAIKATGSNTKARSAKSAVWLSDNPEVAAGYARMAAEDAPVTRLLDESRRAEIDGNFDRAESLILQAEELEGSGVLIDGGGQNIIPVLTRNTGVDSYDARGRSMSDLDDSQLYKWLQSNANEGGGGIEVSNFVDNADYANDLSATHLGLTDPANVRSKYAAFDPENAGRNALLGGLGAAAIFGSDDSEAGVITRGGKQLIEAWHGSPHKFDQFSMDSIGTGEGAQAYGHGLYFADSKGVSQDYRTKLGGRPLIDSFQSELPDDADFLDVQDAMADGVFTPEQERVLDALAEDDWLGFDYPAQAINAALNGDIRRFDPSPETVDAVNSLGSLYRVELDVDPDTLLDWDKPLGEQSEAVQQSVESVYRGTFSDPDELAVMDFDGSIADMRSNYSADEWNTVERLYKKRGNKIAPIADIEREKFGSGFGFYSHLSEKMGGQENLSYALRDAGIPGIRYLDGMSRDGGSGTSNYVMFDDKPIKITERGAATLGGMSAAAVAGAAAEFGRRRGIKKDEYKALKERLLNVSGQALEVLGNALETPFRGYYGMAGGLADWATGGSVDSALNTAAGIADQPISDTAYDLGGAVTDATGSPVAGTAANVAAQAVPAFVSPI